MNDLRARLLGTGTAPVARSSSTGLQVGRVGELLAGGGYVAYAGIGSRETPADICDLMRLIATVLEDRGLTLRSGGAGGADLAFEAGTSSDRTREIFVPWRGFNGSTSPYYPDPRNAAVTREAAEIAEAAHPAWDRCSDGAKRLHTRNVHQVLGLKLDSPVRFVLAWTKDGRASGGTGQAIRIAETRGIPVLNLHSRSVRDAVMSALGIRWEPGSVALPAPQGRLR